MLGWPKRYQLAHEFLSKYSYKRLKLPQILGQLGVFLTTVLSRGRSVRVISDCHIIRAGQVDHLHGVYFERKAYYFIGEGGGVAGRKMSDADHRITDDVKQTAQARCYNIILVAAGAPSTRLPRCCILVYTSSCWHTKHTVAKHAVAPFAVCHALGPWPGVAEVC